MTDGRLDETDRRRDRRIRRYDENGGYKLGNLSTTKRSPYILFRLFGSVWFYYILIRKSCLHI